MYQIGSLNLRVRALQASFTESTLTPEQSKELRDEYDFIKYLSFGSRGAYALAMIFGIDWKKPVSIRHRQIPLIVLGCFLSAAVDFWSISSMWSRHGEAITKYTALKDGVFFRPQQIQAMRLGNRPQLKGKQFDVKSLMKHTLQTDEGEEDQQKQQNKNQSP